MLTVFLLVADVCEGLCDPTCPREVNCVNKKRTKFLLTKSRRTCEQYLKVVNGKVRRKGKCKKLTKKIYNVNKKKLINKKKTPEKSAHYIATTSARRF